MSRNTKHEYGFFLAGVLLGLAAAAVALLRVGASRLTAERRRLPWGVHPQTPESPRRRWWFGRDDEPKGPFIDGVRPPSDAVLDARPQEEVNSPGHLMSEMPDFPPNSQRW